MYDLPELSISPHSATDASRPSPMNPKPAAAKIADAIPRLDWTIIADRTLGKIWVSIILKCDAPKAFDASINCFSFNDSTFDLMILANIGIFPIDIAIIRLNMLAPIDATIAIAKRIDGIESNTSDKRIITKSVMPRKYPDINPKVPPINNAIDTADTPITSEVLPP